MATLENRIASLEAAVDTAPSERDKKQTAAMHAYWGAIGCYKPLSWDATKFILSSDHEAITALLAKRIEANTLTDDDKRILAAIPEYGDTPENLVLLLHEVLSSV